MHAFWQRHLQKFHPESHQNIHPFNSGTAREYDKIKVLSNPGPGSYNPCIDQQKTAKYHLQRQKKEEIEKQFQWIFSNERSKALKISNHSNIGPGSYQFNEIIKSPKSPKHSWGKSSRFTGKEEVDSLPGPGYYNYNSGSTQKQSSGAQFNFKSKIQKRVEFSKQKQQDTTVKQLLCDFDIQKEQYISQPSEQPRKKEISSFFSSKVPRFMTEIKTNLGPGAYEVENSSKLRSKTQLPKMIKYRPAKNRMVKTKVTNSVGPGSYNMNKYAMSRQVQFKGSAISRQTRFNFRNRKNNKSSILPGPGEYMKNRYVFINEQQILNNLKLRKKKLVTLTESKISSHHKIKVKQTTNNYNLNMFDINFRMKKKLQHNYRLKMMKISLPGFNSKVARLK